MRNTTPTSAADAHPGAMQAGSRVMLRRRIMIGSLSILLLFACVPAASAQESPPSTAFAADLDEAREILGIPGMSVAVVSAGEVVFAEGFGFADLDAGIPAAPDTPYGLASVTKPIAATVIMQLVEEGLIDLDLPIAHYGVTASGADWVTSRHLLTHTSEGPVHDYDGNRYQLLGGVITGATGKSFATELSERVLLPLGMTDTALNPLSGWNGVALNGLDEFRSTLGWGEAFAHYPDVYRRLAHPYQFDTDYSTIPGMYHLVHGPAAGLNSSVLDLAAFDLALDGGLLLGDAARSEMLSPAVQIPDTHEGCWYGLGWYTQDFNGTVLQWHTGRWPPSTSALYLRVPEFDLSLIALANTDNLTVPFRGLGHGDVMHSVISLIFHRHFLYPRLVGGAMPAADWSASLTDLAVQLEGVTDPVALEYLERELWAYRQAFASAGATEQAGELSAARSVLFPYSQWRTDALFTALAGPPVVVAPVLAARSVITLCWLTMVWLGLVIAAIVAMIMVLVRSGSGRAWWWTLWLIAAMFLGPIAPFLFWLTRAPTAEAGWRRSLAASAAAATGYAVAWTLALLALLTAGESANALILLLFYAVTWLLGLIAVAAPLFSRSLDGYRAAFRRSLVGQAIMAQLAIGVLFAFTMFVDNRLLSVIPHPISPYFWPMIGSFSLAVVVALWPLNYWNTRRGFEVWPVADDGGSVALPTIRDSWWMVLGTLVAMVLLIGGAVAAFD